MDEYILSEVIDVIAALLIGLNKNQNNNTQEFLIVGSRKNYIVHITDDNELEFFWKENGKFSEEMLRIEDFTDNVAKAVFNMTKIIEKQIDGLPY